MLQAGCKAPATSRISLRTMTGHVQQCHEESLLVGELSKESNFRRNLMHPRSSLAPAFERPFPCFNGKGRPCQGTTSPS
jgi:hypothetical protein